MIFWKLIKSIKKKVKVVGHSVEGRVLTFSPNVEYMRWLTIGSCRYVQCYRSFINLHTIKFYMNQIDLQLTAGNNKGNRRELDFYPTPPEATIALMDFLNLAEKTIWECACGNNAMSSVIEKYGHNVIG